jgi:hypothetical protein
MKISWQTFSLMVKLGDKQADDFQERIWDIENAASRQAARRPKFSFYSYGGRLHMEVF